MSANTPSSVSPSVLGTAAMRVLDRVEWGQQNFGSLVTSREIPRRDVMRLVAKGLVRSVGLVTVCDGDGWTEQPERFREGFVLTDAGRSALRGSSPTTDPTQGPDHAE